MAAPLSHPKPLRSGDRVRLVAASSALETGERLQLGMEVLRSWGLEVEERPELVGRRWGFLAGADQQRAADLQPGDSSSQPGAALLACVRGGWGAARLLEQDLPDHNAWLLGFSDVTSLLWERLARGRGGAIHGPLLTTLAAEPTWSRDRLRALLFGEPLPDLEGEGWQSGVATGPLLAANLTVATHLLGTRHLPDLRGAILVLEDVAEAPYRLERMLTHWRLCGALHQLAGIGFGNFRDCVDHDRNNQPSHHYFTAEQVLSERTADLGIPVVAQLPVGHWPGNGALPLGSLARLDGRTGRLSLVDS